MTTDAASTQPPILVLSDSARLTHVLDVALQTFRPVRAYCLDKARPALAQADGPFGLMILALRSPEVEPLVILYQAGLLPLVGRVPLILISDHAFECRPEDPIQHLDFPFEAQSLYDLVGQTLGRAPGDGPLAGTA